MRIIDEDTGDESITVYGWLGWTIVIMALVIAMVLGANVGLFIGNRGCS